MYFAQKYPHVNVISAANDALQWDYKVKCGTGRCQINWKGHLH